MGKKNSTVSTLVCMRISAIFATLSVENLKVKYLVRGFQR